MKRIKCEDIDNEKLLEIINDGESINFYKCWFINEINLNSEVIKNRINFDSCSFKQKSSFNHTVFENEITFYNCSFQELYFRDTTFEKKMYFELSKPLNNNDKNSVVFSFSRFKDGFTFIGNKIKFIEFYSSYFNCHAILDSINVDKLNLEKSIFNEISTISNINCFNNNSFELDIISNRDTARIVKDSYEKQNNIIEANKYYKIEMKKRDDELEWKKEFSEKLVFKFHSISSNHSQNWLLPIFWITVIGLFFSYFQHMNFYTISKYDFIYKEVFTAVSISCSTLLFLLSLLNLRYYYLYLISFFMILLSYVNLTNDIYFSDLSNIINPFSIMTKGEVLTFGSLIFKSIIAYLIYQLIISIRQNTRRK